VHAAKVRLLRFAQVEVGKESPQPDRDVTDPGLLDLAEAAHDAREQPTGDAVGEQEVEILLLQQTQHLRAERHRAVTSLG
jgi:hypothetical protein